MTPTACLGVGDAATLLDGVAPGSTPLVITSAPYVDVIDYAAAARGERAVWQGGRRARATAAPPSSLARYTADCWALVQRLAVTCAPDATICLEIDAVRDDSTAWAPRAPRTTALLPLPGLWWSLLTAAGFRITEQITLARSVAGTAKGRRSGHYVRTGGQPGQFFPDNTTSTLLVAQRGDPMARLRAATRHDPTARVSMTWARQFLTTCWALRPPAGTRRSGHPCPMDREVIRACLHAYSAPGDCVLDPYAGQGTVGLEALPLGRSAVLLEREPGFAALIRAALPVRPLSAIPRRALVPSHWLPASLGDVADAALAAACVARHGDAAVTERHRRMAAQASQYGVTITPALVRLLLTVERDYCHARALPSSARATAVAPHVAVG